MDLVDGFFSHAVKLAAPGEPSDTEQIDFRRAVSAAYYYTRRYYERVCSTPARSEQCGLRQFPGVVIHRG